VRSGYWENGLSVIVTLSNSVMQIHHSVAWQQMPFPELISHVLTEIIRNCGRNRVNLHIVERAPVFWIDMGTMHLAGNTALWLESKRLQMLNTTCDDIFVMLTVQFGPDQTYQSDHHCI
jgi:hypothetical protein